MSDVASETLLVLGSACVVAAVVGGGLKIAEIELPLISAVRRQVLLATVGIAIVALAYLTRDRNGDRVDPPLPTPARGGIPPARVAH